MNATDIQPSRINKAKSEASRIIRGMRYRDEMAIVAAGTQPRVICGLTGHQRTLLDALESIEPTDGPTKLADAMSLGKRLIDEGNDEGGKTRVIVLSDGCAENMTELIDGDKVQLVALGTKVANLGISRFQVRRSPLDPVGYEFLIEVVNHSDDAIECRLELDLEGTSIDVIPIKIEANGKWTKVVEQSAKQGGKVTAKLMKSAKEEWHDALEADNQAIALLPKREDLPVYLTDAESNLFLHNVLEVNPLTLLKSTKKTFPSVPPAQAQCEVFHKQQFRNTLPFTWSGLHRCRSAHRQRTVEGRRETGEPDRHAAGQGLAADGPFAARQRPYAGGPQAGLLRGSGQGSKVLAASVTGDLALCRFIDRPNGKVLVLTVNLDQTAICRSARPFRSWHQCPELISPTIAANCGRAQATGGYRRGESSFLRRPASCCCEAAGWLDAQVAAERREDNGWVRVRSLRRLVDHPRGATR